MHKTVMSFVTHIECEHDNINCFKLAKDAVGSDRDLLIICVFYHLTSVHITDKQIQIVTFIL